MEEGKVSSPLSFFYGVLSKGEDEDDGLLRAPPFSTGTRVNAQTVDLNCRPKKGTLNSKSREKQKGRRTDSSLENRVVKKKSEHHAVPSNAAWLKWAADA